MELGSGKGEHGVSPVTIPDIVPRSKELLRELTGLEPIEVIGVARDDHGWRVRIELLELARIPSSADVVAEYEVLLDDDGLLQRFQRSHTRLRGDVVDGEAV